MPRATPPLVMSFAASDPTSGAGAQADLLTFASMGCHGLSVMTGITVQDTAGVESMLALDADWVDDQARAVLEDMSVDVFKVGVIGSVETLQVIAEIAADYPDVPLVLDPVLASSRGEAFADDDLIVAMRELLLPQTTLVTPNSLEARRLALDDADEEGIDLAQCAARLCAMGAEYALITGTHEHTPEVVNLLYNADGLVRTDAWVRLQGVFHGSGCTLASACAALLANGLDLADAVREAQEYTWQTLVAAFRPGMGQSIPDRFFWARDDVDQDETAAARGALLSSSKPDADA